MPFADMIQPQDQAQMWNAWYPNVPYTATPEQQLQLVKIREMEEQNMRALDQGKTSQGSVIQQNQQAMQAPLVPQDGVAQMPPMQAVAPALAGQGQLDTPMGTGLMEKLGPIPVIGGVQPTPPSLSFPGASMGGASAAPVEGFADLLRAGAPTNTQQMEQIQPWPSLSTKGEAQPGSSVQPAEQAGALQQAPAEAQPLKPVARPTMPNVPPPPTPDAGPEEKVGWWQNMLSELRRPEIRDPLLTFFGALSAPLAPWENAGSRLARATMMMQMHRGMLEENLRTQDMTLEREQLAMREMRAGVSNKESEATRSGVSARVAEALEDSTIRAGLLKLDEARLSNDSAKLKNAEQMLKNDIMRRYGDEKVAAEIWDLLTQSEYRRAMIKVNQMKAEADKTAADQGDKVAARQKNVQRAIAANAMRQFKAKFPNGTRDQFEDWLATEGLINPSLSEAGVALEFMRNEGEDLLAGMPTGPAPTRIDFKTGRPVENRAGQ